MAREWTQAEVDFLYSNYLQHGVEYCMNKLGRSRSSVKNKLNKLNLVGRSLNHTQKEAEAKALTVGVRLVGQYINNYTQTEFECPYCGTIFPCTLESIASRNTKSCGCLLLKGPDKLTQEEAEARALAAGIRLVGQYIKANTKTEFECPRCGTIFLASLNNITRPNGTKSCGHCQDPEIGDIHSLLTITKVKSGNNSCSVWAQCECGNEIGPIYFSRIANGKVKSCGCLSSAAEYVILQVLTKLKTNHIHNRGISDDLRGIGGRKLRPDFYLPDHNLMIAANGSQHYRCEWGWAHKFAETIEHDRRKRAYCKEHGITYIEIPYTYFKRETLEEIVTDIVVNGNIPKLKIPKVQHGL